MRSTLSLPSLSPTPSPPTTPKIILTNPGTVTRSVSWSIPDETPYRESVAFNLPEIRPEPIPVSAAMSHNEEGTQVNPNTPEFLAWRRLYLSKAKLEVISEMAAVMAGFSIVATVELQINDDANPYLLSAFTVTTAMLVCTTMLAVMISTCILPHIETVAKMVPSSKPSESPHESMMFLIELSWVLANTFSIFFFTLDVILLSWIKFAYFSVFASWCATAIMIPVLLGIFFFGLIFYRRLVLHQYIISDRKYQELEEMRRQLDGQIIHV